MGCISGFCTVGDCFYDVGLAGVAINEELSGNEGFSAEGLGGREDWWEFGG